MEPFSDDRATARLTRIIDIVALLVIAILVVATAALAAGALPR